MALIKDETKFIIRVHNWGWKTVRKHQKRIIYNPKLKKQPTGQNNKSEWKALGSEGLCDSRVSGVRFRTELLSVLLNVFFSLTEEFLNKLIWTLIHLFKPLRCEWWWIFKWRCLGQCSREMKKLHMFSEGLNKVKSASHPAGDKIMTSC